MGALGMEEHETTNKRRNTKNIKMVIGPDDYLFCEDDIQELVKKYANDAYI